MLSLFIYKLHMLLLFFIRVRYNGGFRFACNLAV